MAATLSPPRILPSGDSAITVEFSRNIDDEANRRVLALDRTLARDAIAGVTETVPTYRSLLVHYDPVQIGFEELGEKLTALAQMPVPPTIGTRRWRIPVAYGGEHGIDLEDVAKTLNTTPDDIVARHIAGDYRVAMIGFTPGWSYLSGLDDFLHMPRRQNPRLLTPAGTISIGGVQTGVQCLAGPSGWHLLGRTAVRTYQLHRDPIFLLEPGDAVTFSAVDAKTFAEQDRAAEARRDRRGVDGVMSQLVITAIGPASSVQDGGRYGAQRYGLVPSGAMDRLALAAANCLVGNAPFAAAIEVGPFGATFTARDGAVRVALAGARAQRRYRQTRGRLRHIDDAGGWRKPNAGFCARRHFQLSRDRRRRAGRADVRQPRGQCPRRARQSLSAPAAGRRRTAGGGRKRRGRARDRPSGRAEGPIRVVMGPQDDEFGDAKQLFLDSEWKISATSDRMGYRLEGPVIKHLHGHNIVSDGTVNGSIQVPGNGAPIVLMPDRGTSGGYPKIATVITADLGRFAQIPAGRAFRFKAVSMAEAQAEARKFAELLRTLPDRVHDAQNSDLNIEALQGANVAGAAVNAFDARTWQIHAAGC